VSLKRKIKHWVISNQLRNNLLKLIVNFNNHNGAKLYNKTNDLFSWHLYKNKIKPYLFHPIIDNNFYGIGTSLNSYAGLKADKLIKFYIEHGYYFGSYIAKDSKIYWCNNIITFSQRRKDHLKRHSFNKIYQIGPYIHYAEQYSSNSEFNNYRSDLGKMLLVFPMHASTGTSLDYNLNLFFDFIDEIKKDYDSVVISVFWTDLNNKQFMSECQKREYRIFSAGNRYDQFFLSRLKDIINLSTMTISNGVGTHVIYSVFLNKAHYIFKQKINEIALNKKGSFELNIYKKDEYVIRKKEMSELEDLFSVVFSEALTSKQYNYCRVSFGFDKIKSPSELLKLLNE